jgi:hypothetical protein
MGIKSYLKENWGAPFVIGFMLLLITSAIELSVGQADLANGVAVYAFYALVVGVALQISSYVKYGEGKPEPEPASPEPVIKQPIKWPRARTLIATAIVVALVITSGAVAVVYYPRIAPPVTSVMTSSSTSVATVASNSSVSTTTISSLVTITYTHQCLGCQPLSVLSYFAKSLKEPDGSVVDILGVSVSGGTKPYNFTTRWSDGFVQTSTDGIFNRTFQSNQTLSSFAGVTVRSSDGQTASFEVVMPSPD